MFSRSANQTESDRSPFASRRLAYLLFLLIWFAVASLSDAVEPTYSMQSLPNVGSDPDQDRIFPPLTPLDSVFEGLEQRRETTFDPSPGASANERAMWSSHNIRVVDPHSYSRIKALDNDDPNSFFYTWRPNIFGQDVPDEWDYINLINTDRSDFTDTPVSAGRGVTILETGFTFARTLSPESNVEIRTLPEALIRVGITDEFELRAKSIGYTVIDQTDRKSGLTGTTFGMSDLDLGFKYEIFQQKEWIPLTTLVTGMLLPAGTNSISGNSVQPHFNLVNGWALRRFLFLKHQFGLDYLTQPSFSLPAGGITNGSWNLIASRQAVDSYHSSFSLLYQATKRVGGFVEWYVLYGHNQPTANYLDTGLFIYITPTIQLDCVIGSTVAASDETIFTKAGFSTRW